MPDPKHLMDWMALLEGEATEWDRMTLGVEIRPPEVDGLLQVMRWTREARPGGPRIPPAWTLEAMRLSPPPIGRPGAFLRCTVLGLGHLRLDVVGHGTRAARKGWRSKMRLAWKGDRR